MGPHIWMFVVLYPPSGQSDMARMFPDATNESCMNCLCIEKNCYQSRFGTVHHSVLLPGCVLGLTNKLCC